MAVLGRRQPFRPLLARQPLAPVAVTGTVAVTLDNLTCAASGTVANPVTGTVAVTLASFVGAASGAGIITGTVAVTLANVTGAASGTETITGTVAVTLASLTPAAAGIVANPVTGTVARTLAAFTSTATAVEKMTGTVAVTLASFVGHATDITALYATAVSANHRYIVDQNGDAYFVQGNSPQNMVGAGTLAEMADFFADQAGRGFNSAQVHLVYNFEHDAETNTAPFGTGYDDPNSGYWATIDSMFDLAEANGFTLWVTPADDITMGSDIQSTADAELTGYGTFLGNRYKTRDGLVWIIGNDYGSGDWTARNPKYKKILDGIAAAGDTHLVTIWNDQQAGDANTGMDGYQTVDNGYAYSAPPYTQALASYALSRTHYPMPFVWFEGTYYGELNANPGPPSSTDLELRKLAWWTITAGGVGHFFGTHEVWSFGDWQTEAAGADIYDQLALIPSAFAGLAGWEQMVPDTGHVLLTGGRGTDSTLDGSTLAQATYISGGVLAVIYFPTSRGSITVDTTKLAGTVTGYWLDPTSGDTSVESSPATPTHPGTNDGGDADFVLVLEGSTAVTGTVAVTLAAFTSAASGVEKMTGTVAVTLAGVTSTASGTVAPAVTGTSAQTLAAVTSSATAVEKMTGTVGVTLAGVTAAASGSVANPVTGTVAVTLANITCAAFQDNSVTGTVAVTLAAVTPAAAGSETITGSASPSLAAITSGASGTENITGTAAVTLAAMVAVAVGAQTISITGTVHVTLDNFTSAAGNRAGTATLSIRTRYQAILSVRRATGAELTVEP